MSTAQSTASTYQIPPGRLGNLTPVQETTLAEFRKTLKEDPNFQWVDARHDDANLLRFLRARKFDLQASLLMIREAEKWRKDFGVDELVKGFDFPEKEKVDEFYPQYYHKTDKDGRPLYIESLGKVGPGLFQVTDKERLLKRLVYEYEKFLTERLPATSAVIGHPVETVCTILDLNNATLSLFARNAQVRDYISEASKIGQNYYPELMGKFYILHAGWLFSSIWSVIKGFLDVVTVEKIKVLGDDGRAELLKQIPLENLPKHLGGACQCPGGCSMSDAGPWNKVAETTTAPAAAPAAT